MAKKRPIKQKEWMTITEASRYLSEISDEGPITAADIIQFAMDREIMLSIRTTTPTAVPILIAEFKEVEEFSEAEQKAHEEKMEQSTRDEQVLMTTVIGNQVFLGDFVHQEPLWPGIWDINSFVSGEDFYTRLWNLYQKPIDYDPSHLKPEEPRCLNPDGSNIKFGHRIELFNRKIGLVYLLPTHLIPEDSYLGIRREEFQKLFEDTNESEQTTETLSTRERNTLNKMILGMAIEKYGYKPEASRNSATGENAGSICADLEKAGLPLDSETIKKKLEAAFATTPPEKS